MNYIEQIKGFWLAQENHQLGTSEIALYFHLLEVCNKTGWTGIFYRNNYKVMADLSIRSYKTFQSVRDKLQQAGIITYKQKKGDANVEYKLNDLGKKYLGKVEGLGKGSGIGLGKGKVEGLGKVNINQTKPNQTKQSKSHCGANAPPKEKKAFWKNFVDVWDEFYKKKFGQDYGYLDKDWKQLEKIHSFLEKRAAAKKMDFTEENLIAAFSFFLNKAWDKDEWIRQNFNTSNVLSQFNQIANGTTTTTNRRQTGAGVDMQSAYEKLNRMSN